MAHNRITHESHTKPLIFKMFNSVISWCVCHFHHTTSKWSDMLELHSSEWPSEWPSEWQCRITINRMTDKRMTVKIITVKRMTVNRMTVNRMTVNRTTVNRMTLSRKMHQNDPNPLKFKALNAVVSWCVCHRMKNQNDNSENHLTEWRSTESYIRMALSHWNLKH